MKVRLLTAGAYSGLEKVQFPVEVEAELFTPPHGKYAAVPVSELERIGARIEFFTICSEYNFKIGEASEGCMGTAEIVEG